MLQNRAHFGGGKNPKRGFKRRLGRERAPGDQDGAKTVTLNMNGSIFLITTSESAGEGLSRGVRQRGHDRG